MSNTSKGRDPAKTISLISLGLMIFLCGGAFALNDWQPFKILKQGYQATAAWEKESSQTESSLLGIKQYQGNGVVRYAPEKSFEGVTLMQGIFTQVPELRLIDMNGKLINTWHVNFFEIFPNPKHITPKRRRPKTHFNYHTQGFVALPDGSVVISMGNYGSAKLDRCSNVVWTVPELTHHSVTPAEDGGFWLAGNRPAKDVPESLFFMEQSYDKLTNDNFGRYEQLLIKVDKNGKIVKRFSVLQALVNAGLERSLARSLMEDNQDPTHLNDIEIVTKKLATKVENIKEGDLLASLRNMDMLIVLDQNDGSLKWYQTGNWVRQHDPDITKNGNIVIYNNTVEGLALNRYAGSNLIELNPANGESWIIYPTKEDHKVFFSDIMGSHQLLANGNRLITQTKAGRVFEIDQSGSIVWEYIKPYADNKRLAALIEISERYPADFFKIDNWSCNNS